MKTNTYSVRTITEIAIFAALGFVFDELQSILLKGLFPNGGSIGFAMIAVVIIAYRRGLIPALITGLIMGLLDVATGPFIVGVWQVFLDYIFPYVFVAAAAIFVPLFNKLDKGWKKTFILILSIVVGGLLKFLSHYLSGVIFFYQQETFAWGLTKLPAWVYSAIYNIAFMGPCIVLTSAVAYVLYKRLPKIFETQVALEEPNSVHIKTFDYGLKPVMGALGIFLTVFFTIRYALSFEIEKYEYYYTVATDVSVNVNAFMLMVSGILLVLFTTLSIIKTIKHKHNDGLLIISYGSICLANIIYAVARVIRLYRKHPNAAKLEPEEYASKMVKFNYDLTILWTWIGVFILLTALFVILYLVYGELLKKEKNNAISEIKE